MGEGAIVGFVVLGIVIVVLIIVASHHAEKQRRAACKAFATQHGWTYAEEDPAYVDRWDGAPFKSGHGRKAANVITGEHRSRPFVLFEHRHQTTSSNGQTTTTSANWHTVYVFTLPASVPRLELKPKGFFGGIADWFGVQDIHTGDEDFDNEIRVRSDDEQYARLFLSNGLTRVLRELEGVQVRVYGNELVVFENGRQVRDGGTTRLDKLVELVGMIPGTIWSQYGRA